jgi:hypothetical protein
MFLQDFKDRGFKMAAKGLLTIIVTDETLTNPVRCFSGQVNTYQELENNIRDVTGNRSQYYRAWLETQRTNELIDSNPAQENV